MMPQLIHASPVKCLPQKWVLLKLKWEKMITWTEKNSMKESGKKKSMVSKLVKTISWILKKKKKDTEEKTQDHNYRYLSVCLSTYLLTTYSSLAQR